MIFHKSENVKDVPDFPLLDFILVLCPLFDVSWFFVAILLYYAMKHYVEKHYVCLERIASTK